MSETEQMQQDIREIKERNARVERDKAWETSWTRKVLIAVLTYVVVVVFFLTAQLPDPFLNALVPTVAFILSTLSVSVFKKWWGV